MEKNVPFICLARAPWYFGALFLLFALFHATPHTLAKWGCQCADSKFWLNLLYFRGRSVVATREARCGAARIVARHAARRRGCGSGGRAFFWHCPRERGVHRRFSCFWLVLERGLRRQDAPEPVVLRARARAARAPSCPLPRSPPEFTEASQTHPPMSWYRKRREHLCREPNTDDGANSHTPVSWRSLLGLSVRHVGRAWLLVCTRP